MRKSLLLTLAAASLFCGNVMAEKVTVNGKEYDMVTLQDRDLGPGVRYTRLRLPGYPLNVNMLRIDVTNPYNSVETTQASDKLYGTEALVNAAKRQSSEGHKALAGANANFWCVSGQPPFSDQLIGVTYNGNVKNGKIITELNMHNDQWNGGYKHTGILGITPDRKVYSSNNWTWKSFITNDKIGSNEIFSVNKVVRDGEMNIYNSYYGTTRTFRCVDQAPDANGTQHFTVVNGVATEVYLTIDAGEQWSCGDDITFTVKQIKQNAGGGTIGSYDLAIVGRGDKATILNNLAIGDKVTLNYTFVNPDGQPVKMQNLVGGNAQVMVNGEMTKYATSETYNSQVYSRTGYGTDADNKTLYICVIDKATDPVYGNSAGCSVTVMCDIMKTFGCVHMTNFDAGGSAEMLVDGAIINKTTEGSPRAVANGMIAYSIAPADNNITRLEFWDYELKAPIYSSYQPRVLGYNQYGALVSDNLQGFTLSCPEEAGSCQGEVYTAGGQGITSTLTATYNGVSVTKNIEIVQAQVSMRVKPVHIDASRKYPIDVTAEVDGNIYNYNPAAIDWTVGDASIINVDADGVLTGVAEGTTTLTAKIGTFTDQTEVTVEVANAPAMPLIDGSVVPAEWKTSGTGTKNWAITPGEKDGSINLAYNVSSTRGTKVVLAKDIQLYSLPDAVKMTIDPKTSVIKEVVLSMQPANADRPVSVTKAVTLTAGVENDVEFDLKDFGDPADIAFYPLTFRSIGFTLGSSTGNYTLAIPTMQGLYNNYVSGVNDIIADGQSGDVDAPAQYFNLQGMPVNAANATPGIYIVRRGNTVNKVIIK